MLRSRTYSLRAVVVSAAVLILTPACVITVHDIPAPSSTPLAMTPDQYGSAVWLNDHNIAFTYTIHYGGQFQRSSIGVFDLSSAMWRSLDDSLNRETASLGCRKVDRYAVAAYSSTELAFRDTCYRDNHLPGRGSTEYVPGIKKVDIETGAVSVIQPLVWLTHPGEFAFSPGNRQIVQGFGGDITDGEVSYYAPDVNKLRTAFGPGMVTVSTDHRVAREPDWSEPGIVFFAAGEGEKLPRGHRSGLSPFDVIGQEWQLLLFDPVTEKTAVLLNKVVDPRGTSWSPDSEMIAFVGEVEGKEGIWVFNLNDRSAQRIWPRWARFDWSPDGTRIVISESRYDVENSGYVPMVPLVIDMAS